MQLLQSKGDWDVYVGRVLGLGEVSCDSASPASYPCLASIARVASGPVVCFMYVADAQKLLEAARFEYRQRSPSQLVSTEPAIETQNKDEIAPFVEQVKQMLRRSHSAMPMPDVKQAIVSLDRADFDRRVAAFIFSFLDTCVPADQLEAFEKRFTSNLAAVDGMHSERADAIRKAINGFEWLFPDES